MNFEEQNVDQTRRIILKESRKHSPATPTNLR